MKKRKIKIPSRFNQYDIPFWGEWLEGDCLKRRELVEGLPVLKEMACMGKLPKKQRIFAMTTLLNSFFEDLESAVYTKISIKNKKNHIHEKS